MPQMAKAGQPPADRGEQVEWPLDDKRRVAPLHLLQTHDGFSPGSPRYFGRGRRTFSSGSARDISSGTGNCGPF